MCIRDRAHHGEIETETLMDIIVQVADAISGARPGARRETLESYIKRLESLEKIATDFKGIEKAYAIQAGREISINPELILENIEKLTGKGVVEITLVGQNVNSYGKDLENPVSFSELLKKISAVKGLKRIRFMTSHPKDFSDELIDTIAGRDNICLLYTSKPEEINDDLSLVMAKDIARKIESEMEYPGQIKVTVIRESRCLLYTSRCV